MTESQIIGYRPIIIAAAEQHESAITLSAHGIDVTIDTGGTVSSAHVQVRTPWGRVYIGPRCADAGAGSIVTIDSEPARGIEPQPIVVMVHDNVVSEYDPRIDG